MEWTGIVFGVSFLISVQCREQSAPVDCGMCLVIGALMPGLAFAWILGFACFFACHVTSV